MDFREQSEAGPFSEEQEAALARAHVDRAAESLRRLENAETPLDRFHRLGRAARGAYCLGHLEEAEALAAELLRMAPNHAESWDFGNAVHYGHTALGLVALERGDRVAAVEHLLHAGATPGSPQLNTFGPTMELARQLMKKGEFEAVERYLVLCRRFWASGTEWLRIWDEMVARRAIPNCFQHRWR